VYHEALERGLRITRPDLTLHQYRTDLERFLGFYETWERRVAPWLTGWIPDESRRFQKTNALRADLEMLGLTSASITALPRYAGSFALSSRLAALGSLYVIEGSTLGGQWISRHVEDRLGLTDGQGYTFFLSYGPEVGEMWSRFVNFLNAQATGENAGEIESGAVETFQKLHAWFSLEAVSQ
jgi:heme oxygenase